MNDIYKDFVEQMEQYCKDLVERRIKVQNVLRGGDCLSEVKVDIDLKVYNPALYKRPGGGAHIYRTRLLTEEELNDIRRLKWKSERRKVVVDFFLYNQGRRVGVLGLVSAIFPGDCERIVTQDMPDCLKREYLLGLLEREFQAVNGRMASTGLPYRLTYVPRKAIEHGGYRFYIRSFKKKGD